MGLGRSEMLGLTCDDIGFKNKTLIINKILTDSKVEGLSLSPPKTESSVKTIKMTTDYQRDMNQVYGDYYYSKEDFIYCRNDGTAISPNNRFTTSFRLFIKKHVPFPVRFHDLRHTHATLLLEVGVNPKVIQERLGHTTINTTLNIYSHVTKEMEDDSVDTFENLLN